MHPDNKIWAMPGKEHSPVQAKFYELIDHGIWTVGPEGGHLLIKANVGYIGENGYIYLFLYSDGKKSNSVCVGRHENWHSYRNTITKYQAFKKSLESK